MWVVLGWGFFVALPPMAPIPLRFHTKQKCLSGFSEGICNPQTQVSLCHPSSIVWTIHTVRWTTAHTSE